MLFQISSVAASASTADALTCKLKTSWKWLLVWGSLSFQTLRRGVNLRLNFSGTSILISHTRSLCSSTTSSPGITFTSVTRLPMVLRKGWSLSAWLCFPTCTWWDGCHVSWNVFQGSRLNARARVLSPSTSGSGLLYPKHHALPCIQCLHGLHGRSNLHMGLEIWILWSWQSQHAADQRTCP